jgi:hypothetical protein
MIWREKQLLLIILAVLLIANTAFFFTYRVQYEQRLQSLDTRLHDSEARLQRARAIRMSTQQQIDGYRRVENDLQMLYNQRWATEAERLTALVTEIKKVTAASQLIPQTLAFAETTDAAKSGTSGTGTSIVHINFSVQGTYQQVRRLINLLELSDQFVIIDAISIGAGAADKQLTLNMRLKTVFRDIPQPPGVNKNL